MFLTGFDLIRYKISSTCKRLETTVSALVAVAIVILTLLIATWR